MNALRYSGILWLITNLGKYKLFFKSIETIWLDVRGKEEIMKATNLLFKSSSLGLLVLMLSTGAMAQQADGSIVNGDVNTNNNVVNNRPIDVDGYITEEAPVTDQELEEITGELNKQKTAIEVNRKKKDGYRDLQKTTKTLTNSTEKYLKERRNAKKNIDAYNKKLECLMETESPETCNDVDKVELKQAASQKVETSYGNKTFEKIKIIPFFGSTAYVTGNDQDQLIAQFKTGAMIEADFGSRFSAGIGFSYSQLNTLDVGGNSYGFGNYYNPAYYGVNGREVNFRNMSIDATGKYTLFNGDRVRPYIGANVSLNFARINYEQNNTYNPGIYSYGNEELFSNYLSLGLNAGTEFYFTNSIGMNLDLGYTKGIGGRFNNRSAFDTSFHPDQRRLQDLGDEIAQAHAFSLTAGMLIAF